MALSSRSFGFILLIAGLAAMPPLSIDMSLPAMGAIGASFGAPPARTGLTLSLFMAGFALAELGFGPLLGVLGLASGGFGLLFATCAIGIAAGSLLCGRLVRGGVDPHALLAAGVLGQAVFSLALLVIAAAGAFRVADALPLLVLNNLSMGIVAPLAIHGAMEPFADRRRLRGAGLPAEARRSRGERARRRPVRGNGDSDAAGDVRVRTRLRFCLDHAGASKTRRRATAASGVKTPIQPALSAGETELRRSLFGLAAQTFSILSRVSG